LNIDSNNFDYLKLYADLSFELARYDECIESLKACLKLNEDDLDVWLKLIDSMVLSGLNTSALAYTEMGLKIHMNTAALTYRLGALHYLHGNQDMGTLILEKAKDQDPEYILLIREVFPELFLKNYQDLNPRA
jgi:tetratricopeptide (TPR) repeat protein